jgi:hypothetical protein
MEFDQPDEDEPNGPWMTFQAEAIDLSSSVASNGFRFITMRAYVGGKTFVDFVLPTEHVTAFAQALAEYGD